VAAGEPLAGVEAEGEGVEEGLGAAECESPGEALRELPPVVVGRAVWEAASGGLALGGGEGEEGAEGLLGPLGGAEAVAEGDTDAAAEGGAVRVG